MRKFLPIIAVAAGIISIPGATAQTITPVGSINGGLDYIGAEYTKSGKGLIVTTDNRDESTLFTVYDENLDQVATVTVPKVASSYYREVSYRILEYNPYGPKGEWGYNYFGTQAEALDAIKQEFNGYVSQTVYNGRTIYYPTVNIDNDDINQSCYFEYYQLGTRYPSICYYINPPTSDNQGYELVRIELWSESYLKTNQWTQPVRDEDYYSSSMGTGYSSLSVEDMNTGIDRNSMDLTQTLFNDDSDFEYIQTIYNTVLDRTEESEYTKTSYYTGRPVGFSIRNSSGRELQKIMFENNPSHVYYNVCIVGNKRYFVAELSISEDGNYTESLVFYTLNPSGTGLQQVAAPLQFSVAPTVIRHDENLNVELTDLKGEGNLSVTDVAGRSVFSTTVRENGTHQIPGRKLSTGMNIVTLSTPSGNNSTKVIVK